MSTESFYAIRRTDGEQIYGEFAWMGCDSPDDWTVAEENDGSLDPVEYEIVRMTVESICKRSFPLTCKCTHDLSAHGYDFGQPCEWDTDECQCAAFEEVIS